MEPALDALCLLHVDEHVQNRCVQRELCNLITLDVCSIRKAELLEEATSFGVDTDVLILILFHVRVSVDSDKTLLETGG